MRDTMPQGSGSEMRAPLVGAPIPLAFLGEDILAVSSDEGSASVSSAMDLGVTVNPTYLP